MADEEHETKTNEDIAELLSDFLLSAEVSNAFTLDEFKEVFPFKYRDHNDVKLLYKAFQSKRKKIRTQLKRNIATYCVTTEKIKRTRKGTEEQEQSKTEEQQLTEKISDVKKDIKAAEKEFIRCAKVLNTNNLFQGLNKKDFDLNTLQVLESKLGNK